MTLLKFREQYNEAPYDLEEFARGAAQIDDCAEDNFLQIAAQDFLNAKHDFEMELRLNKVEVG